MFACKVAEKAMKHKMYERVMRYREWCIEYFNTYVNHFIVMEGGWLPNTLANIKDTKAKRKRSSTASIGRRK